MNLLCSGMYHSICRRVEVVSNTPGTPQNSGDQPLTHTLDYTHHWEKPPPAFDALNYDDFVSNLGLAAGCGDFCRNIEGKLLFAFSHKLEPCSSLEAETWAIYHGLCLARNRGYRKVVVLSDSLQALDLLRGDSCSPLPLNRLVQSTQQLSEQPFTVPWKHISREGTTLLMFWPRIVSPLLIHLYFMIMSPTCCTKLFVLMAVGVITLWVSLLGSF